MGSNHPDLYGALRDVVEALDGLQSGAAAKLGIGITDLTAMRHLTDGPVTARVLASALGLTSGSTTVLVDRLVAAGFVRREPHATDRRSVNVVLTDAGQRERAWVDGQVEAALDGAMSEVDADEDALVRMLGTTATHLVATAYRAQAEAAAS
jgi:DNA-binding MarR family transcriptional regulator